MSKVAVPMSHIVPAILEDTPDKFLDKLARIIKLPNLERIQVDFGDGKFVPHTTVSIADIDPLSPGFTWEAHLMVEEPVDFLDYQIAGFTVLIVHLESFASTDAVRPALQEIRKLGMKAGLAINPETPVEAVQEFVGDIDHITLLNVHPGKQHQEALPESVERLQTLRQLLPSAILEVDGGVKSSNIHDYATADFIAVGSALFETENVEENYDRIMRALT